MKTLKFTFLSGIMALLLSACGGGDSSQTPTCTDNVPLSVSHIDNTLTSNSIFTQYNITPSDTTIIYEDGNQGKNYDIDQVALTTVSSPNPGNTLALSYSVHATQDAPAGTSMALYIDNIANSGDPNLIDADIVIIDHLAGSGMGGVYTWSGSGWVPSGNISGTTSSTSSYTASCSLGLAIFVPWKLGLEGIDLTNASGLMMLTSFVNGDPGMPNVPVDYATFSINFPAP